MSKSPPRAFSITDRIIGQFDGALRALTRSAHIAARGSPSDGVEECELNSAERRHSGGLMRVNHSGEVCAQALYQGQALTAKLPDTRQEMELAAMEEVDHLVWCEERLSELDTHVSVLNPLWYGLSFGLGAGAGLVSDRVSLGFVAATEDRVCHHLEQHLEVLPEQDHRSRAIVKVMLEDEYRHGQNAINAGGYKFPWLVKMAMRSVSSVMTASSYRV